MQCTSVYFTAYYFTYSFVVCDCPFGTYNLRQHFRQTERRLIGLVCVSRQQKESEDINFYFFNIMENV